MANRRVYTGTMETLLARGDLAFLVFVHVSGIPYVFGEGPLPASWGSTTITLDSEVYTWDDSLIIEDSTGVVTTKAAPKAGMPVAGQKSFSFRAGGLESPDPSYWNSVMVRNIHRTDEAITQATATFDADDTTLNGTDLTTAPAFVANEPLHFGLETVVPTGITATTATGCARGKFGSWAAEHIYSEEDKGEVTSGGAFFASWPLAWRGRIVTMYLAFGAITPTGGFQPYEDGSGDPIQQPIYRGVCQNIDNNNRDSLEANVDTNTLDSLLNAKIGISLPTRAAAKWAPKLSNNRIYVGGHNRYLSYMWYYYGTGTAPDNPHYGVDLRDADGAVVGNGYYTVTEICNFIGSTIAYLSPIGIFENASIVKVGHCVNSSVGSGDDYRVRLHVYGEERLTTNYALMLSPYCPGNKTCILRYLGYTSDAIHLESDTSTASSPPVRSFVFPNAGEAPPAFYWPEVGMTQPTRLYFNADDNAPLAMDPAPGWVDDDATAILGIVRVDDQFVFAFDAVTAATEDDNYKYLTVDTMLEEPTKEYIIPYSVDQDTEKGNIVQGFALTNCSIGRVFNYILGSGSGIPGTLDATWDQGWLRSGLALPTYLYDDDGFAAYESPLPARDLVAVFEPTSVKDIFQEELRIEQALLYTKYDWTAGTAKLSIVPTTVPSEVLAWTSTTYDSSNINTFAKGGGGVQLDRRDDKLINRGKVSLGYRYSDKKHRVTINQTQITSQESYGIQDILEMKSKSLGRSVASTEMDAYAKSIIERVFDRYAFPYEIHTFKAGIATSWLQQIGGIVNLESTVHPSLTAAGRGIVVPVRVYETTHNYFGEGFSSMFAGVSRAALNRRYSNWSPAAKLESVVAATGDTVFEVYDSEFSKTAEALDISWFAVNDVVYVFQDGASSGTYFTRTITNVDLVLGRVTFNSSYSTAINNTYIVARLYNGGVTAYQKRFVFANDGTKLMATDRPYTYGA